MPLFLPKQYENAEGISIYVLNRAENIID